MKILIVEDDETSSQVLEQMVSRHGRCTVAGNGQQALELFRKAHEAGTPYSLIFMDIMMPEVDGLKSVREIRVMEAQMDLSAPKRVKIVMTTALADPRTVMKALYESDANSYLVKPIRLQKLEDELRGLKLIA